jgi:hypothetical protein
MRPQPPGSVICSVFPMFEPSPDLERWARETLINADSEFSNPDHEHLQDAVIGFLWTNTENASKGRRVIGQAEQPVFRCGKWQKARQEMQMRDWFGDPTPDFIITLDAIYCIDCTDMEFMALVDHELTHCGQAFDEFGSPRFNQDTGRPVFTMKPHDVEEFVSIVRRYGVGNPDSNLAKLVAAANSTPTLSIVDIAKCCGTCLA